MASAFTYTTKKIHVARQGKVLSSFWLFYCSADTRFAIPFYCLVFSSVFLSGALYGLFAAFVALVISPLQYIKIKRQQTHQSYFKIVKYALAQKNPLSIFFVAAVPYVVMNFLANMSFGFSDFFCQLILHTGYSVFASVLIRSILGGIFETIFTIYPEVKEIVCNKGDLAKSYGTLAEILLPATIRNTIAWVGAALGYELSFRFALTIFDSVIISLLLGMFFGMLSIPFDVIATQNCGSDSDIGMVRRALKIFSVSKMMLFAGSFIRICQIAIFTATTVLTMFVARYLVL